MASSFIDVCRFNPTLGGTTDWTYSSAVTGYQSPTAAAAVNGAVYSYRAESADLLQWEVGYGAYNSGTGVFARTTVLFNSAGTTAKINFSTVPQVAIVALAEDLVFREKLIANRTYYVLTTGSDSNDGLTNTSGGAFLTLQKAMDVIAGLDCSIYNVTVNVGAGTYAGLLLKSYLGAGTVTFNGDTTTPSNVVVSSTGRAISTSAVGGSFVIQGFRVASSTSQDIAVVTATSVSYNNMEYNGSSANFRIYANFYGRLTCTGANHKVLTGGIGLFLAEGFGALYLNSSTFTFGANVTYTGQTASAKQIGYIECFGTTFSLGAFTVTGPRYAVQNSGGIAGTGAAASFFPGNSAGTNSGGFYA